MFSEMGQVVIISHKYNKGQISEAGVNRSTITWSYLHGRGVVRHKYIINVNFGGAENNKIGRWLASLSRDQEKALMWSLIFVYWIPYG